MGLTPMNDEYRSLHGLRLGDRSMVLISGGVKSFSLPHIKTGRGRQINLVLISGGVKSFLSAPYQDWPWARLAFYQTVIFGVFFSR